MGLYCKYSIALIYIDCYIFFRIINNKNRKNEFKLISFRRYSRYIKLIFTKNVLEVIIIFSIISNSIILMQNYKYDNLYKKLDQKNIFLKGIVVSIKNEKYKVKLNNKTFIYLYTNDVLEIGEEIEIHGVFSLPNENKNYKGFNYKNYLKTLKVYGHIKASNINIISKNNINFILKQTNKIHEKINNLIDKNFGYYTRGVLKAILIGNKDEIDENIKQIFSESNISYILAISGMHINYIILIVSYISSQIIGKHFSKIITSIVLVLYMFITNFSPSVVRATIIGIIMLMSNFVYRKNDLWESLGISGLLILIYNPFLLQDIGFILSFMGTIGIVVFMPNLKETVNIYFNELERKSINKKNKIEKILLKIRKNKIIKVIEETIIVTLSANIAIFPIILLYFNKINITNIIIGVIISFVIVPIIVLGFLFIILRSNFLVQILEILLRVLIKFANIGSKLPLNQIYFVTPSLIHILIYYFLVLCINFLIKIKNEKNPNEFYKRINKLINLFKFKIRQNNRIVKKIFVCLLLIFFLYKLFPKDLKIYFIDVGQGDSTLIVTPHNKKILIDGGGNENSEFDIGKETLMPYLLDRKIINIDYMIISHFDSDHVQGLFYVLQEMKVKNVIIGTQFEENINLEKFIDIIKEKKIKVKVVKEGTRINIEKKLFFDVISPSFSQNINENLLNNNALVIKLNYKTSKNNFSMLFTGDIEEKKENILISKYCDTKVLKSTILKVAHHGSKTSSTEKFLKLVEPKIAVIGVGKNNIYGHPNSNVIKRLQRLNCCIYRTDLNGEISFRINFNGKIKTKVNNKVK